MDARQAWFTSDPVHLPPESIEFSKASGGSSFPVVGPDGANLGTFFSNEPAWRNLTAEQRASMACLGRMLAARLEQSRAETEARKLALVAERTSNAVILTDALGRIEWVNAGFTRITEYTLEEVRGRKPGSFLQGPETDPQTVALMRERLRTGKSFIVDVVNYSKTGRKYWLHIVVEPFRNEDGQVTRFMAIESDLTEIKEAEAALRRSEEQVRRLNVGLEELVEERTAAMRQALATLDATEDGAFIFDPETLRHSYVNEGAVRQLGYDRTRLLQMTPLDFNPDFDEAKLRMLMAPMIEGKLPTRRFSTRHRHLDGREIPVEINLQYVAAAGGRPRFIAIARDITEREQHERLTLRSQRLEAIGTLAGGVAHDLNNALAPIMMGMEMLRARYPEESRIMDMFQTSAKRGADMVRQLLTFAKGTDGERVALQPGPLVKEMQSFIQSSFPKNIHLTVHCDPGMPTVLADATQIHQILLNLCVNARDAMPFGGTLKIDAQRAVVDADFAKAIPDAKPGEYVVLRVRDTGTGIPPEIMDRILDPFFTTKGPDKGTGLGLSTVVGILKGHGGFLHVTSQMGQGSDFGAYLPVEQAQSDPESQSKTTSKFRGDGQIILFVDDDSTVREMVKAVFRRLNFKVLIATDGTDGLVQAAEHRNDLSAVITDVHMPHLDGVGFVRALRRILPDIPVIASSGRMEDAMTGEFKSLGVTNRLDKPFTEAQLSETLGSLLGPK